MSDFNRRLGALAVRMSGRLAWLGLVLCAAGLATSAAAQTKQFDLQSFYRTDLRALAMGNAFGPIARGENALLYNPAGLVQFKLDVKIEGTLALEGEQGDFFKDSVNVFRGSPSATDVSDYLSKYLGRQQYYRTQTFYNGVANLAAFNVGLGAGKMKQTRYGLLFADTVPNGVPDIDLVTPANPATNDSLLFSEQVLDLNVLSFAFATFSGQLISGITLKNFKYSDKLATDTFGNLVVSQNVKLTTTGPTYSGSAYDLGFLWRQETFSVLRAQWSLVANNVGGLTLQQTGYTTVEVPASYDIGWAMNPELPWSPVHLLLSVEYEDASGAIQVSEETSPGVFVNHDRSRKQRLHVGAELGFWQTSTGNHILNVRMGSNRGLATSGFELNLFSGLRLVYTRYQDDFGWDTVPAKHKFQAVQLTLGFAF